MKYKVGYLVFIFVLSVCSSSYAQVQLNFNGLGRSIITSNNLTGPALQANSSAPTKGVSGYTLFDLQPNIIVNNTVKVSTIMRLRNPFGSFYGTNTTFAFRQFLISGRIGKAVEYQIGDIYLGDMTKYTMYKPNETYSDYESEIHAMRRSVVNYENFVQGNKWRLQGVQGKSLFGFNRGIKTLGINLFAVRTNATNQQNVPDRILAGGRVAVVQSEYLAVGVNYVGMMDIHVNSDPIEYSNNVGTIDAKLTLDRENYLVQLNGEFGGSNYKNVNSFTDSSSKQSDYVYEAGFKGVYKPAKLKLFASYRSVGAQFTSPTAQTTMLNVSQPVSTFSTMYAADKGAFNRPQGLYDRFTDEQIYNRAVSPVLYNFLPQYGNITPYGDATANRQGFNLGLGTDTSAKIIQGEIRADLFSEIVGEGVVDKRKYTGLRGGLKFNFGDLLKINRKMSVNFGSRYENTTRGGAAPINFKSMATDIGCSIEMVKKFDFLLGVKLLNASGNEYLSTRNAYNSLSSFTAYSLNLNENIYSVGLRLRFGDRSYFTANYNVDKYKETKYYNTTYRLNQLFFNYTLIF